MTFHEQCRVEVNGSEFPSGEEHQVRFEFRRGEQDEPFKLSPEWIIVLQDTSKINFILQFAVDRRLQDGLGERSGRILHI